MAVIAVGGWAFWPEIGPSIKPIVAKVRGISKPEGLTPAAPTLVAPAPATPAVVKVEPPKSSPAPAPEPASNIADALAEMVGKRVKATIILEQGELSET